MTPNMFVKLAEEYFGEYRPVVKQEVMYKLMDWSEWSIQELWDEARETIQTSFKTPPDIYFIGHSAAQVGREKERRALRIENNTRRLMGKKQRQIGNDAGINPNVMSVIKAAFKRDADDWS